MTVERGPTPALEDAQTRGFLFADIRGYTEYLERHGATAAAELLGRYRAIVRATIAEHRGAEIRTEGDSFYVVLPTASAAVRCALAIVERVESDNTSHAGDAIRVGIGVHAGEAIETDEGLVGSAINIAARLSSIARPGEVLMSDTVRALTRSVIPVRYIPRGRHRLKGVAEPQQVFAAVSSAANGAAVQTRWVMPRRSAFLAVGAVIVLAALGYAAFGAGARPGPTVSPTRTATAAALASTPAAPSTLVPPSATSAPSESLTAASPGPSVIYIDPNANSNTGGYRVLAPGSYRFPAFRPTVEFTIRPTWTDRGWWPQFSSSDMTSLFALHGGVDTGAPYSWEGVRRDMLILDFVRLQTVIGNACNPGDTSSYELLGGRPRDVVDWLKDHPFLETTNLKVVPLAGLDGLSIDVALKDNPNQGCSGSGIPPDSVSLFKTTSIAGVLGGSSVEGVHKIRDGETHRMTILDVGGDAPLVLVSECRTSDCPKMFPWAQDFIDTITLLDGQ